MVVFRTLVIIAFLGSFSLISIGNGGLYEIREQSSRLWIEDGFVIISHPANALVYNFCDVAALPCNVYGSVENASGFFRTTLSITELEDRIPSAKDKIGLIHGYYDIILLSLSLLMVGYCSTARQGARFISIIPVVVIAALGLVISSALTTKFLNIGPFAPKVAGSIVYPALTVESIEKYGPIFDRLSTELDRKRFSETASKILEGSHFRPLTNTMVIYLPAVSEHGDSRIPANIMAEKKLLLHARVYK